MVHKPPLITTKADNIKMKLFRPKVQYQTYFNTFAIDINFIMKLINAIIKYPAIAVLLINLSFCGKKNSIDRWSVLSPDSNLVASLQLGKNGTLNYTVLSGSDTIIGFSPLGLIRSDQAFDSGLVLVEAAPITNITEKYTLLTGKRKENNANANELLLTLKNAKGSKMQVIFRAYNEGVAFRYKFPDTDTSTFTITEEKSGFAVSTGGKAWLQPFGLPNDWGPAYEELYLAKNEIGASSPDSSGWSFPALFQASGKWILLAESDLTEAYAGTRLAQDCENGIYKVRFPLDGEGLGTGDVFPKSSLPFATSWKSITISNTPAGIFESNMVSHLAAPQVAGDFSWVKPGRASWGWWGEHDSPKDFKRLKEYVDLAKEMNWEYSLVDANWDLMTNGGTIEDLAKYANSKNIPLLLWYNSGGSHNNVTERPRDIMNDPLKRKAEFKKIRAWGVKGVKIDFFQSDKQNIIKLYIDVLKDAAAEQIMVVFHGCTVPRGWSRTYPNLVSMEAVRGAEQYGWSKSYAVQAASHNTILAFSRNVVGSMDYTPVTFSDYNTSEHQTTNAHELALPIVFESGITHWADREYSYRNQNAKIKELMKVIPTTWDDSKLVAGEPGSLAVVARQKGQQWFIGGINGDSAMKTTNILLPFITAGSYKISIYADGDNSRSITVKDTIYEAGTTFTIKMLPKGGFSAWIRK